MMNSSRLPTPATMPMMAGRLIPAWASGPPAVKSTDGSTAATVVERTSMAVLGVVGRREKSDAGSDREVEGTEADEEKEPAEPAELLAPSW